MAWECHRTERLSNRRLFDTSVYLFRPTVRNRLRCAGHSLFYATLKLVKGLLGRRPLAPSADSEDDQMISGRIGGD